MKDFLERALFWALVAVVLGAIFLIPAGVALWLGLAWGIIATAVVCAGCVWLGGELYVGGNIAGAAAPLMLVAIAGLALGLGLRWVM